MVRNLFDQYQHDENRLTHALLCSLNRDRKLLSSFIKKFGRDAHLGKHLEVAEQTIPGSPEPAVLNGLEGSLPDGVIFENAGHDGKKHALIIESKITAPLRSEQLRRHTRQVEARGFAVTGLAITADTSVTALPPNWSAVAWTDVYGWLVGHDRSIWSTELRRFFEILEAQMMSDERLGDRALTRFDGIPFGPDHEWTYPEAKRLLRLLRKKLLAQNSWSVKLGVDKTSPGVLAIKNNGMSVFDVFQLRSRPRGVKHFTQNCHLTFVLRREAAAAYITVPDKDHAGVLQAISNTPAKLESAAAVLLKNVRKSRQLTEARPTMIVLQRRWPRRSAPPLHDAQFNLDLRTIERRPGGPKYQPEWLGMVQPVLRQKRSNVEMAVGCEFDYRICAAIHRPDADQLFIESWLAAKSFFSELGIKL